MYYNITHKNSFYLIPNSGSSSDAEPLAVVCGMDTDLLIPVISNRSNEVTLVFVTDGNYQRRGFSLKILASKSPLILRISLLFFYLRISSILKLCIPVENATLCHPQVNQCENNGVCELTDLVRMQVNAMHSWESLNHNWHA